VWRIDGSNPTEELDLIYFYGLQQRVDGHKATIMDMISN
jgi:hypothetical protein